MLEATTRPCNSAADEPAFISRFKIFIADPAYPCVGAKAAMNRDRMEFALLDSLGDAVSAEALCERLGDFSRRHPCPGSAPVSFVAMFRARVHDDDEFHRLLWRHLQAMTDFDARTHRWNPTVSADPDSHEFSFSIASRAFFVVGLHPGSKRSARQAPFPCLVFNFHDQFEAMRESGLYEKLQHSIRLRDIALQGSINPVLSRFGKGSEAAQYSGNAKAANERCPFHARAA